MSSNNGKLSFPEELRSRFEETDDLVFKDGSRVTAAEIWRFMTEEAPRRFPYTFDKDPRNQIQSRISEDFEFFTNIKHTYLTLTQRERLLKAHNNGTPIVLQQAFQTSEPYYAAGVIPLGGGSPINVSGLLEGLNLKEYNSARQSFSEAGRRAISVDICSPQLSSYAVLQESVFPVDFISPIVCTRCSDVQYLAELYRSSKRKYPAFIVDYPVNGQRHKKWAATYMAKTFRRATKELSALSKKEISEEDLRKEIKIANQGRKLMQDYMKLWWSAKVPPTNSVDHAAVSRGYGNSLDPILAVNLLKETYKEVKERVKHSIKGKGLADDPVRLFGCGGGLNPALVDKMGGVNVGTDDQWSQNSVLVDEAGDPYENLAKAYLSFPHEQPLEERGLWTAEQVRKSRADGVVLRYQWGCNHQSAAARIICDIVKDETGLPTIVIEQSEREPMTASEQLINRGEAFIEMLTKNK